MASHRSLRSAGPPQTQATPTMTPTTNVRKRALDSQNPRDETPGPVPKRRLNATDKRIDLLETGRWSDFKIKCGQRVFNVHRAILLGSSLYFDKVIDDASAGENRPVFKEGVEGEVDLSDLDETALSIILKLIYMDATPKSLGLLDACPGQPVGVSAPVQALTEGEKILARSISSNNTISSFVITGSVTDSRDPSARSEPSELVFDDDKLRLCFRLYVAADRLFLPSIKDWSYAAIVSNLAKLVRWPRKDHFLDIYETLAEDVFEGNWALEPTVPPISPLRLESVPGPKTRQRKARATEDEEYESYEEDEARSSRASSHLASTPPGIYNSGISGYDIEKLKQVVAFAGLLATWFNNPVKASDLAHAGQTVPELGWYLFDLQRREMERCRKCYGCPRFPFEKHCKFLAVANPEASNSSGGSGNNAAPRVEWIKCFCFFSGLCSVNCLVDEEVEEVRAYCHQCAKTMNPARIQAAWPYERRGKKIVVGQGGHQDVRGYGGLGSSHLQATIGGHMRA